MGRKVTRSPLAIVSGNSSFSLGAVRMPCSAIGNDSGSLEPADSTAVGKSLTATVDQPDPELSEVRLAEDSPINNVNGAAPSMAGPTKPTAVGTPRCTP